MSEELLTAAEAARRLGVTTSTLYDWLGRSRIGALEIRGQKTVIQYFQGGARGQGRIRIEAGEVDRLRDLMRVRPLHPAPVIRRPRIAAWPGITVPLGRPR